MTKHTTTLLVGTLLICVAMGVQSIFVPTYSSFSTNIDLLFDLLFIFILYHLYLFYKELVLTKEQLSDVQINLKQHESELEAYQSYLQQIKAFYSEVLDHIPIDIAVFNPEHEFIFVNKNSIQNSQLREWLINKTEFEYCDYRKISKALAKTRLRLRKNAIETKLPVTFEEAFHVGTPQERYMMRGYLPVFDTEGALKMVVGYGVNITASKQKEVEIKKYSQELEKSNKALQQYAHIASHDLKAPLRVVHSFLQLLNRKAKHKLDESELEYIHFALSSIKQLSTLIEDLLNYARLDRTNTEAKQICVSNTLDMLTLRHLKPIVQERGASIEYSSELPVLMAHHSMITPLFQNLIINGLKYNRSTRPKIKIWVSYENNETIFAVQDNGIGIAPEHQSQLFAMFKRLHPQEFEGTGIGLASCKRVIEFYGGWIKIESAEGQGSTFYFTLPNALPKRPEMTYTPAITSASKPQREAMVVGS